VRQSTGFSADSPMTIEIKDSQITSGNATVIFNNDGGSLRVDNVAVSDVTTSSFMATANAGVSILQDSSITSSSMGSVTYTTAGAGQSVLDVKVSGMKLISDTLFYVQGAGSTLAIGQTAISNNKLKPTPGSWTAVAAQESGVATVTNSSISGNTGMEFGLSATLAATITIKDTVFEDNQGLVRFVKV